jgi:predicted AAA+ superfamily ATPase
MLPIDEIHDDQSKDADIKWMVKEKFPHTSPVAGVLEEFQLTGREAEKIEIMKLISKEATQQFEVIAVWGMGGLGKTTLVKDVYQRHELNDMFARRAFVTVLRPFKLEELLRTLATQVCANAHEKKSLMNFAGDQEKDIASMTVEELIKSLDRLSAENKCLIVLDDLSSTMEWDIIMQRFLEMKKARWTIVITTRQENIAKHCCKNPEYIRLLNGLQDKDAYDLFTNKVPKVK